MAPKNTPVAAGPMDMCIKKMQAAASNGMVAIKPEPPDEKGRAKGVATTDSRESGQQSKQTPKQQTEKRKRSKSP